MVKVSMQYLLSVDICDWEM